jgi:hypothetical protein
MRQIDYVSTTALTPINLEPYTEHGGGGFKKLVSVVAIVAIPIAAPIIAGSIGLSTAIGSAMASGLVGAGLGAAVGSYTGQGMRAGAIMGGLSGALAGYSNPGVSRGGVQNQPFAGEYFRPEAYQQQVYADFYGPGAVMDGSTGQYITDSAGNVVGEASTGVTSQQPSSFVDGGTTTSTINTQPVNVSGTASSGQLSNAVYTPGVDGGGVTTASLPGSSMAGNQTLQNLGTQTQAANQASLLSRTGSEIAARFTDPKALADVSIQAGINLIGAELMGVGDMSDEEKELLAMQKQQMEELKARDKEAYDFAMKRANELYAMGQRFDPEQLARQYYGKASQRAGLAKRDALRNINPANTALRAAEERRFNLGAAANTGSAYDRGMIAGLNQQANYLNKSAAAFPNQGGNYSAALTGLNQTYANLAKKKSAAQQGFNQMFGAFGVSGGDGNDDYRAGLRDGLFGTRNTFRFS